MAPVALPFVTVGPLYCTCLMRRDERNHAINVSIDIMRADGTKWAAARAVGFGSRSSGESKDKRTT